MLNIEQFLYTLPIMLKGMGGIFLVTAAIIVVIAVLNLLTGRHAKPENGASDDPAHH